MADLTNVSRRRVVSCTLVLSGNGRFLIVEASGFNITYSLNDVPNATVAIPLGREAFSGNISPGYLLLSDIFYRVPAFLFLTIRNDDGTFDTWNISTGTYLLFAGYITKVMAEQTAASVVLQIALKHWLFDLDNTSTLSAMSHPGNPTDLLYNPLLHVYGAGGGLSKQFLPEALINPTIAKKNFWSNAVYPLLRYLASIDRINVSLFMNPDNDGMNNLVKTTLSYYTNSLLSLSPALGSYADLLILDMINGLTGVFDQRTTEQFVDSLAHQTLWNKLKELGSEFFFTVVPYPTNYQIVPTPFALSYVYLPTGGPVSIFSHEILGVEVNATPPAIPLRAVGVYSSRFATIAGANLADVPELNSDISQQGWYVEYPDPGVGTIKILTAPRYLQQIFEPSIYMKDATGYNSAHLCSSKDPQARKQGIAIQQKYLASGYGNILDRLAHFYYVIEQTQNKILSVRCPFRGDIAPGSNISVAGDNNNFLPSEFNEGILYGTVLAVTYSKSPGDEIPYTTYTLGFVRNKGEFLNSNYSLVEHPFYYPIWYGGPHLPRA